VARTQYDLKAALHKFLPQQLVLLDEHSFLHKNLKLAPKWLGPHKIIRLKGDSNVEILLRHNNRKTVVNTNRLKPYFVALSNSVFHPDNLPNSPPAAEQSSQNNLNPLPHDDYNHSQQVLLPNFLEVTDTAPSPAVIQPSQQISPHRRARNSSTSSSVAQPSLPDDTPPAMRTRSRTHSSASTHSTPAKQRIFMPQVVFEPQPIFQGGEGLEVDNEMNEGITVNYVNEDNSWTLVQRRKKKKTKRNSQEEKWNAQQKENSVTFTRVSPIKTTAMLMWDHQSQTSYSSNQWLNLPLSKLFHLPQRFHPQCNHRPSLQQLLHLQSLLLRLRQSQLHKVAKNAPGLRPFR
jgi:hypothetical protein